MFTRPKRAGEEIEGTVKFNPKSKARFLSHSLKAVNGMGTAAEKSENEEILPETPSKTENLSDSETEPSMTESEQQLFDLVTSIDDDDSVDINKAKEEEAIIQELWDNFAKFLIKEKLAKLKPADFPITIDATQAALKVPIFKDSDVLKEVIVEKRFSSRKLPHLLTLVNSANEKVKYIFKENDDISMDVAVMELLALANEIWRSRKCPAHVRTYNVVSTINNTGFCECIPGDTMLVTTNEVILKQLGTNPQQWESFYYSLVGVMVATAAFDITDRHDNNALFTPDGDIALIDMSASMGKKAPMDLVLGMNPIYFPARIKQVHKQYRKISGKKPISEKLGWKFWGEVEEDAMVSYYSLYNNYSLHHVLKTCSYKIPAPIRFLKRMNDRKNNNAQVKEKIRNDIVQSMEDSDVVSKFVSTVCKIVPGN